MKKRIVGENGISYTLGADELYYPDLVLPEGTHYQIGKYGRMRAEYLKEYRKADYMELLLYGKWNEYLHVIDEECHQRIDTLMEQLKVREGITEKLKTENQMKWVGMMNNIRHSAEEIVFNEIVYN